MKKLNVSYRKYTLRFRQPAGTSRGVMHVRESWFVVLHDPGDPERKGIGECAPLPGLSTEKPEEMEKLLGQLKGELSVSDIENKTIPWPSLRFGLETAFIDLKNGGSRLLFSSPFTEGSGGIPINGLIWMGDPGFMKDQIRQKIDAGFRVLKMKVGALDFDAELDVLKFIRNEYPEQDLEIRLDANGAFTVGDALEKINRLAPFGIHSIEQPIAPGQWEAMSAVIAASPVPVALDEELIGITEAQNMENLLLALNPHYLILKPTLLGGFGVCEEWIRKAEQSGTGWWITSALESNVGLNAIAQWTATLETDLPQGLGTGQLFLNNFSSPLKIRGDKLFYNPEEKWDLTPVI